MQAFSQALLVEDRMLAYIEKRKKRVREMPEIMQTKIDSPFANKQFNDTRSSFGNVMSSLDFEKRRQLYTLPKAPEKCFLTGLDISFDNEPPSSTTTMRKIYALRLEQLIYMPSQDMVLEKLGRIVSLQRQDCLLFGNRNLPPFVRLLFPSMDKVSDYIKLQKDPLWLQQQVFLSH